MSFRVPPKLADLKKASPPQLKDTFEASPEPLQQIDPTQLRKPKEKDPIGPRVGKALGYTLALALGLAGGLAPSLASGAEEQVVAVQKSAVQRALRNPRAQKLLRSLPANFQSRAAGLSDAQVKVLKGGIKGETSIGPLKINNRNAFIRGHVVGKKVWPEINKQIRDARHEYSMINAREEKELYDVVQMASRMSKGQRETMAQLMDYVAP